MKDLSQLSLEQLKALRSTVENNDEFLEPNFSDMSVDQLKALRSQVASEIENEDKPKKEKNILARFPLAQQLGKTAVSSVLGSVPDTANFLYGAVTKPISEYVTKPLLGKEIPQFPYTSDIIKRDLDTMSGFKYEPESDEEKALDTAASFLGGTKGGIKAIQMLANKVPKLKLLEKMNPKTKKDWAAIGASGLGSSYLGSSTNDSTLGRLIGSLVGGAVVHKLPVVSPKNIIHPFETLAKRRVFNLLDKDAIGNKNAGKELGLHLTPAEATGNPLLAVVEGSLGTSSKGAKKLHQFHEERYPKQVQSIEDLLNDVSKNKGIASENIRNTSQKHIKSQKESLQNKAKPLYTESYNDAIPEKDFKHLLEEYPVIGDSLSHIKRDAAYKRDIRGYRDNSIKVLDYVKKNLDDDIKKSWEAPNRKRLLTETKNKLLETMDEYSPVYKKARSIYAEDAPNIEKLEKSHIGKIANIKDLDLDKIPKIIFDPTITDPDTFKSIRNVLQKENPKEWSKLIRNDMENRMAKVEEPIGSTFYKTILGDDRRFKQYYMALNDNPLAQRKLNQAKITYKNLINERSVKSSHELSKSSLSNVRASTQDIKNWLANLAGGQYDQAMIDLITNENWDKEYLHYMSVHPKEKSYMMLKLLNNIDKNVKEKDTPEPKSRYKKARGGSLNVKICTRKESLQDALRLLGKNVSSTK